MRDVPASHGFWRVLTSSERNHHPTGHQLLWTNYPMPWPRCKWSEKAHRNCFSQEQSSPKSNFSSVSPAHVWGKSPISQTHNVLRHPVWAVFKNHLSSSWNPGWPIDFMDSDHQPIGVDRSQFHPIVCYISHDTYYVHIPLKNENHTVFINIHFKNHLLMVKPIKWQTNHELIGVSNAATGHFSTYIYIYILYTQQYVYIYIYLYIYKYLYIYTYEFI